MAYDLARKTITPRNFAINLPDRPMSRAEQLVLGTISTATLLGIMQDIQRQVEKRQYQKKFQPGLSKTQQLPAMPMRELIANGAES
jgi:hypothetical protein